jgi:hypothetical protein
MPPQPPPRHTEPDEPPPFFRSWGKLYAAVAVYLAVLVALFDLFTRTFNR